MEIKYVVGDATLPEGTGNRIIAHVCNDYGGWGRGFVLALSARDHQPEVAYRGWHIGHESFSNPKIPFALGKIQLVPFDRLTQENVFVANMIAQRGSPKPGDIPLSYLSLASCLSKLHIIAQNLQASVHMPRIGCGLAGGEWPKVEMLVKYFLTDRGIPVTVYDLPVYGMMDSGGLEEQRVAREQRHNA